MPTFLLDLENGTKLGPSILPGTTITTDTTTSGTAVDCLEVDGPVTGLFFTGNSGDASTTIVFKLTECDTSGGTYTDIADGVNSALAGSATLNDNLFTAITCNKRTKRYVKCAVTTAGGGTPSVTICAGVIGKKKITGAVGGSQL